MKTINFTTGTCTFQLPVRVRECWALKSDFFEPSTPGCTGTAWIWINNKFYNINYHVVPVYYSVQINPKKVNLVKIGCRRLKIVNKKQETSLPSYYFLYFL